jgi:ABC-2 type transport system permease protein
MTLTPSGAARNLSAPQLTETDLVARPMPGLPGAVHDGWVVTLRNLRRMTRIPEMVVFATIQPIMFVLLFAFVFGGAIPVGGGGQQAYREYLLPGIFTQTLAFTTGTTAVGLADDLHKGLVDRFRSLPMARSAVLVGRTVADWFQNVFVLVIMALCGLAVGWRVHDGLLKAVGAILLLMLFAYAMSWIGAVIGLSVSTPETANTAGFIWLFPVTFVSNAFVPTGSLPGWLQPVAEWNPISATVLAQRQLFGNPTGYHAPGNPIPGAFPMQHPAITSLIWSAVILAVFVPMAIRKYRSVST